MKLLLVLFTIVGYSQTIPIDTIQIDKNHFYVNYKHDFNVTAPSKVVYKKEGNKVIRKTDSVYDALHGKVSNIRKYLRDSTVLSNYYLHYYAGYHKGKKELASQYKFVILEKKLKIVLSVNTDSLVTQFFITKPKKLNFDESQQTIIKENYEKPTSYFGPTFYNLGDNLGQLIIDYYDKCFIKSLSYRYKKGNKEYVKCYYFYYMNRIKEYGTHEIGLGRIGTWYEHHKNGNLKTQGNYLGSHFDKDYNETKKVKDNLWFYYDKKEELLKSEKWVDGVLVK